MAISTEIQKATEENRPRVYNIDDPAEIKRLYRECFGYLKTCHNKHGTDWEGRLFAMQALKRLEEKSEGGDR